VREEVRSRRSEVSERRGQKSEVGEGREKRVKERERVWRRNR